MKWLAPAILVFCSVIFTQTVDAADNATPQASAPGGGLFMTGQRLAEICAGKIGADQPDTFAGGTCLGYINGTAAILLLYGGICYNNVTNGEVSDTVVKYMNDHPDEVPRYTAIVLIGIALKAAYPVTATCRQQIGGPAP